MSQPPPNRVPEELTEGKSLEVRDFFFRTKSALYYLWDQTQTFVAGSVTSVFGRTGTVTAQAGDYDASQITETAGEKIMTSAERTKLSGIETSADVTDSENVGSAINGSTEKTTPVDADKVGLIDSAAANALKWLSWSNIKTTLKAFFDTLYHIKGGTDVPVSDGGTGSSTASGARSNLGLGSAATVEADQNLRTSDSPSFDTIRLTSTADASLSGTGHAWQVGPTGGFNLIADNNEIMARNNGAASQLNFNADGGDTTFGTNQGGSQEVRVITGATPRVKIGSVDALTDSNLSQNSGTVIEQYGPQGKSADCNTLTNPGIYRLGDTVVNGPAKGNFNQLLTMYSVGDTISQIIINYSDGTAYWRAGNPPDVGGSGSWSAWRRGLTDADLLDEDDFASNSATKGAVQQSIKAYVDNNTSTKKNYVLNPNFSIWQAGISFTFDGASGRSGYVCDGWIADSDRNSGVSGEATVTRQSFTPGQTNVPGEPEYYLQFNQTVGSDNGSNLETRMEDVRTLAGEKITVSFYAKVNTGTLIITPRMQQVFGSGGSARVNTSANEGNTTLTTSWQRFVRTFDIPSISGKTIGTPTTGGGPSLDLSLLQPAGSTYTFQIAQVRIDKGTIVGNIEQPNIPEQLSTLQRYYQRIDSSSTDAVGFVSGFCVDSTTFRAALTYSEKYIVPTITVNDATLFEVDIAGSAIACTSIGSPSVSKQNARINANVASGLTAGKGSMLRSNSVSNAIINIVARI